MENVGSTRLVALSAVNAKVDKTNKKSVEHALEQYARTRFFPNQAISVYSHGESDTGAIVIIEDINFLRDELVEI